MPSEGESRQSSIQVLGSLRTEKESIRHDESFSSQSLEEPRTAVPSSTTKPAYVPQFSAASSLILDRLKGRSRNSNSELAARPIRAASTDTQSGGGPLTPSRNLSDTLAMPPQTPLTAAPTFSAAASPESTILDSITVGGKRKRDSVVENVDFTQDTIAFPWTKQHKAGAGPEPQHSEPLKTCTKCEGSPQTPGDPLTTCSRCLNSWHLQCHSPLVANATPNFVCSACAAQQDEGTRVRGRQDNQRQHEVEELRRKRLATLPQGVNPAKPELVGFGPGRAPDTSRTEYFSNKKRVDLLNVLSFCDQLKPQLLTDILVSVSKKHPDLPLFDSPDWEAQLPSAHRPAKATPGEKARQGHTVLPTKARIKTKATKKILKRTRVIEVVTDAPGLDDDVLPPTWSKAGEGMYAKLAQDTEERDFLMDDNDEEAFSHFMVNSLGKQIVEAVGG